MRVSSRVLTLFAVAGLVLLAGTSQAADVTVKLEPQNNSGESGTATLSDAAGKTKVTIAVSGQPAGSSQPMHIHKGTCKALDPKPAYNLPALAAGKAEATLDVPLSTLQKDKFAINGHKSAQEASVYVFCGDIPAN